MFSARVHDLMRQKSNIQYKMLRITRKISDLQAYAAYVGNNTEGRFDISELLNMPGSMIRQTLGYTSMAYMSGIDNANRQTPELYQYWLNTNGYNQDAQTQQANYNLFLSKMYEDGVAKAAKREEAALKREEEKLKAEKDQLEVLSKEIEQELEAAKQARDAGIKEMAPKYTAGN